MFHSQRTIVTGHQNRIRVFLSAMPLGGDWKAVPHTHRYLQPHPTQHALCTCKSASHWGAVSLLSLTDCVELYGMRDKAKLELFFETFYALQLTWNQGLISKSIFCCTPMACALHHSFKPKKASQKLGERCKNMGVGDKPVYEMEPCTLKLIAYLKKCMLLDSSYSHVTSHNHLYDYFLL